MLEQTIKTKIHTYCFDVSTEGGAKAYADLCAKMKAQGTKCFETHGGTPHYNPSWDGLEITLETAFVFPDQWNTAPIEGVRDKGIRVFDWAQDYQQYTRDIKQGHYLDLTPAMIEVRANRLKCGYCGKQYDKRDTTPAHSPVSAVPLFHYECLGSPYLKCTPNDLKMTRIRSILEETCPPLTPAETETLTRIYHAEQAGQGTERNRKARTAYGARIRKEFEEKTAEITTRYGGMQWLFNRGCPVHLMENCIYYPHKDLFKFGWRSKIDEGADLEWLLANLPEFGYSYKYNIETAKRGTL